MQHQPAFSQRHLPVAEGFSLLELLVSVIIIVVLMSMVFGFLEMSQKRYRSQQMLTEATQGGRSVLDIMSAELRQAGYNPPFQPNKTLGSSCTATSPCGPGFVNLPLSDTTGIFYGSDLIIGNNCVMTGSGTSCDQEEALVNTNPTISTSAITSSTIPIVLALAHPTGGEPIFVRNYPFPQGILIQDANSSPGIADNKIQFFGDLQNTGYLYYAEYRLQCANPPGVTPTFVDACTTPSCMTGPFVLTRFMTKLSNNGVFAIPSSKATAFDGATTSPLLDNVQGECASTAGVTWPANEPDDSSSTGITSVSPSNSAAGNLVDPVVNINPNGTAGPPVLWMTVKPFSTTLTYGGMATDAHIYLTVQQRYKDPLTGNLQTRSEIFRTQVVPENITHAFSASANPPGIPVDPSTGNTLPLN
jgi:type II secretory pathway pseudopilin PulG